MGRYWVVWIKMFFSRGCFLRYAPNMLESFLSKIFVSFKMSLRGTVSCSPKSFMRLRAYTFEMATLCRKTSGGSLNLSEEIDVLIERKETELSPFCSAWTN
jgi:hypothetical protein